MGRIANAVAATITRRYYQQFKRLAPLQSQEQTLADLLRRAKHTQFGRDHNFAGIDSVNAYQQRVPLRTYEDFNEQYFADAYPRLSDVSWPGAIPYFGLSSGTTAGSTKNIPLSMAMLNANRQAALTSVGSVYSKYPDLGLYRGKFFFLGGSTDLKSLAPGVKAGDLSAIVVNEAPSIMRRYTFPPRDLALISDWNEKLRRLVEEGVNEPITGISGVPSWVLLFFAEARKQTGKATIKEIWPDLRLIVHGGIKFDPYRDTFAEELGGDDIVYLETYPASEGFIAFEDQAYNQLRLMLGHGIFFEFVPLSELASDNPTRHWLGDVETGVQYAVVLSTNAGLWSYIIGDTIEFTQRDPFLLRFTGRTKYYLSAFGEHVISDEVERAVAHAAEESGARVSDFHVGPDFPANSSDPGRHHYFVEFNQGPQKNTDFALLIDDFLCRANQDYESHRRNDLSMMKPALTTLRAGAFRDWMAARGKLGGQNKVPRMDNSGEITRDLATWAKKNEAIIAT
jgi:hypothetical protein